ncbi:hypothetical protein QYS48_27865 [Marivirga arenosa]|uniref:Uncharacterized protein n=1 Tax=Marivirga arenosa TaxID=3059076 RepID=A0AA51N6E7_9BACT|nr:hypothetical protein [Marivirga sp. ABR2-2]WMN07122.1 hypothetical protein QYS48_27865 [Marivirga sp. ABR2-2]
MRDYIFESIKKGIKLENGHFIEWGTELSELIKLSNNHYQDDSYISLQFGEFKLFENIDLNISTSKLSKDGTTLTSVGTGIRDKKEVKSLIDKLIHLLGKPDEFYDGDYGIFTHWENNNNRIEIITRDHHGGSWCEFHIKTKKAPNIL